MSEQSNAVDAWEALYRAQVAVLRQLLAEFPHDDVSFTEYDVLFNLFRQPGYQARIRELNRHLLLTQPSVSRLLDRLVSRGLVEKSNDPTDARGTLVALTATGLDVFRRIGAQHSRSIALRMGVLDADELHRLTELTDKLRAGDAPN